MSGPSALFTDLVSAITERGRTWIGRREPARADASADPADIRARCEALLSRRGEASGLADAIEMIACYEGFDTAGRTTFFEVLRDAFGPDRERVRTLVDQWFAAPSDALAGDLHFSSEPRRQALLRRINQAPGGTRAIVAMRADLLRALKADRSLAPVDRDFAHLLGSWFNRGFLVLRRIDWSTPAIVLEKIIRYEAVHEIRDFPSLRLRIDPSDRRCYGFFHPALPDEPLIFVEVALTNSMPDAIGPLLDPNRLPVAAADAKVAVFYSISNCQRGLAGISFGNFLIKQVVEDLRREFMRIETFVTLSPVPGLVAWLRTAEDSNRVGEGRRLVEQLSLPAWTDDADLSARLQKQLEPLAARYLLQAKKADNRPVDPVANFHLGNGARLERINWLGDRSTKGLGESAGLMVNYLYDLAEIERNHEAFVDGADVAASPGVRKLAKREFKPEGEAA